MTDRVFGEIVPFTENTALPPFPVDALPAPVAEMCRAVAVSVQVPCELPATVALGVLAACCQNKAVVRIGADYVEPLNLFTLAIANSGERKSPVFRVLTAPVYAAQEEYFIEHADEIARSQREYSILKKQLDEAERKLALSKGGEYTAEDVHELDAEIRAFDLLVAPKLLLDDVTSEKLIDVLDEQGGSVTIASAEGGLFINLKNKAATNATFDVYLKAYSGDSVDVKRIGREGNSIKSPRLSLVLTCQTDVAKDMINNPTFREKGLPARFLYAMCRSNVGNREVSAPDISHAVKADYDALIRRLLTVALDRDYSAREITLTADGRAAYHAYSASVEARLGDNGAFAHMTDWGAKLAGQMLRIAGIVACCEGLADIDADTITRAADIAEWFAANADYLFSPTKERVKEAQHLLSVLLKTNGQISMRELQRKTHGKRHFSLPRAIEELAARNYIILEDTPTGSRTRTVVYVNPLTHGDNGDNSP